MDEDPSSMHVMYVDVEHLGPGNRLRQLANMLVKAYKEAGLLVQVGGIDVVRADHHRVLNTWALYGCGGWLVDCLVTIG